VDGDLVTGSGRASASATGDNLSFNSHCECCSECEREEVEGVMSTRGADSYFSIQVGHLPVPYSLW
jgi:hypothetical protein